MARVDDGDLARWRRADAAEVLQAIAEYAKVDSTFVPVKDRRTTRWHAAVRGRHFELLLTGPKFFDTRAEKGGGGAVDLAVHLLGTDFRTAAAVLRGAGL